MKKLKRRDFAPACKPQRHPFRRTACVFLKKRDCSGQSFFSAGFSAAGVKDTCEMNMVLSVCLNLVSR